MEPSRDNRTAILEVALGLFSERGYEAVGVAELSEAAGITKPTLYHYFGSKRGLLDAVIAEYGSRLYSSLAEAARYQRDVPAGLLRIARAFARFGLDEPRFSRLRIALAFAPPSNEAAQAAAEFNLRLFEAVEAFFQAAERDHGNMRGRSRAYAAAFIGTIDTYVGLHLAGKAELSDRLVEAAVRQFMYGIFS